MRMPGIKLFKSPLATLIAGLVAVLVASTLGFWWVELSSREGMRLFDSLWWTVVTLTTVGYGDIAPVTPPGRVLGMAVMFSGIGLVSALTGNLASFLVEQRARRRKGLMKVRLSGQVVVLGWNAHGPALVQTLKDCRVLPAAGLVLVGAFEEAAREELAFRLDLGEALHFVFGQPSLESVVDRASPATARVVYILADDSMPPKEADQQAIYAALTCRSLAPKVPLYGQVVLRENREHLLRAGVDEAIVEGEITSHVLGMMGQSPSVWSLVKAMVGLSGPAALGFRPIGDEERALTWGDFSARLRRAEGGLALALCKLARTLSLQELLDETTALDSYILELFKASGSGTDLGRQGLSVALNPADGLSLEGFDAVLYLKGQVPPA
jgi:voltage-gated potassium channel